MVFIKYVDIKEKVSSSRVDLSKSEIWYKNDEECFIYIRELDSFYKGTCSGDIYSWDYSHLFKNKNLVF